MNLLKEKLLNDTFQKVMDVALKSIQPLNIFDEIVAEDVMGFGTTIDEKIFSLSDFRNLINRQREQSEGIQMEWDIVPVHHRLSADGNFAVFADDVTATVTVNNKTVKMDMRFTLVFEFQENKWLVVHFHGSKPENVLSEADTFGIEDWKQKNAELEKLVNEKTAELQKSLAELKATQSHLIHAEKMASLGELTAGIAHEIQNPLNFVNNFSEVSNELLHEMKDELSNGSKEEAISIADDVIQNLEKVLHHGKRADAIVKGMLMHSRSSSGTKEPTDINALADEYLRLAYHGLRAKEKSFNADFKFEPDESLPKINVIPQDIGRVLLNLINNAFYAVTEKKKEAGNDYEPTVTVSTRRVVRADSPSGARGGARGGVGVGVEVIVKDNGNGIPDSIKEKIFQPFFTTKPTGQGTGLGLSLAYDIVKAHSGELMVNTKVGENLSADLAGKPGLEPGTEFIISLPISNNR